MNFSLASSRYNPESGRSRRPPATSLEARENQLISLAVDEAEKQIRAGTASSQVLTHFLKLGTGREQLEREKLRRENLVLEAKASALEMGSRMQELTDAAIEAMRSYKGLNDGDD